LQKHRGILSNILGKFSKQNSIKPENILKKYKNFIKKTSEEASKCKMDEKIS